MPAAPPAEDRAPTKGVTADLIPYDQRGGLFVASSVFAAGDGGFGGGGITLEGRFRLGKRVYLDTALPLGIAGAVAVGNPSFEVRGIVPLDSKNFLIFGGGLAFPILNDDTQRFADQPALAAVASNAMWDVHQWTSWTVPLIGRFGTQHYLGRLAVVRTHLDPVLLVPFGDNDEPELQIQHSAELQFGQVIGGGLRVQGVALPTWDNTDNDLRLDGDLYQVAIEPFFSYEGEVLAGRFGVMLPIDEQLGPPLATSWGLRMGMGARFD